MNGLLLLLCCNGAVLLSTTVQGYDNVALHKPTWQQHPYFGNKYGASLAVDGRKTNFNEYGGECVASNYGDTAEWRVDLERVLSIHHIAIQYSQNEPVWGEDDVKTKSFLGFSLYVSNTTTKEDGVLCFKDTNYTRATIPNPVNITCPYHGRYVIYYNNRTHPPYPDGYSMYAYTYLCEVEVFGCSSPEFYGKNCSMPCPRNCQEGHCHIVEGNCLGGCLPGYTGVKCNKESLESRFGQKCDKVAERCESGCQAGTIWMYFQICDGGMFGKHCNESCGKCLNDGQCHHINGSCLNGCNPGYHGVPCTEECPNGKYGHNCEENCSMHCTIPGNCNKVAGHCIGGCQAGWKNTQCDQECDGGMFGKHCNESCGKCLNNGQCHHINGSCLYGCYPGYHGMTCAEECPSGKYGHNCEENCNLHCTIPGNCDKVAGNCIGGCQAGWKNTKCEQECDGGMFGKHCNESCGKCLNDGQCHHINGSCLNGCDPGYHRINCTEECDVGLFGANCAEFCSLNCKKPGVCDKVTGQCEGGCQAGWTQRKCDAICVDGMFGQDCTEQCGECLRKGQCHHVNGTCVNGFTTIYGQDHGDIPSAITAPILITVFVIIVVVVLFIGCKRWQSKPQHNERTRIDLPEDRIEINAPMTNNTQGYAFSMLYANDIQSYIQEITPNLECENASNQRKSGRQENSEAYLAKETIFNDNQVVKCSTDTKYDRCSEHTPDILVNKLQQTIVEMKKNDDEGFKREYSMLSNGELFPCNVGKQKESFTKNRYKTTFPYDHSRVILQDDNGCPEYINASYIEDSNRKSAYIATQGPKENTVNDFWKMIWQQNVTQIVMLTNLKEGGKKKCFQYWPNCSNTQMFGNFTTENVSEKHYASYITRKFVISHKQQQMSRDIIQYHYIMWPDHGIPEPLNLAIFHSKVLGTNSDENRPPMLVHCSAGIGRTGTFIALDALYKEGKRTGKINVMKYVKIMRSCRMNMVQSYGQYMTIFIALNERFKAALKTQSLTTFKDKFDRVLSSTQKQTCTEREFEKLLRIRQEYTIDDYLEASQRVNKNHAALPLDKYMLYLTSSVANRGTYINAIAVCSYLQDSAFLVTHCPPPEDAVDFLRLLIDHESNTVICMDPLSEIESSKSWLPGSSSDKLVAPFSVQSVGKTVTDVKVTDIRILTEKNNTAHDVSIVEPRESPGSDSSPMDTSSLSSLVSYAMNVSTEGPITIVSKDGASLCGAFCAVFNCVQQIQMDDNVDVFTTVRQLQTRRPEFCSTLEEYLLVYRALHDYIGTLSQNIYENM